MPQFGSGKSGQQLTHERQHKTRPQVLVLAGLVGNPVQQDGKQLIFRPALRLLLLAGGNQGVECPIGLCQGSGECRHRPAVQRIAGLGQDGGQMFRGQAVAQVLHLIAEYGLPHIAEDAGVIEIKHGHRFHCQWLRGDGVESACDLRQVFRKPVSGHVREVSGLRLRCCS